MADFDYAAAPSLRALAHAIAQRQATSEEATAFASQRLHQAHDACNAVVTFEDDEALGKARAADAAIQTGQAAGPLAGVPLAHKDMFDRRGKIASWGGNIQNANAADDDATVIRRLEAAGTHQIAALHLTEFAFGPTGHNYVLGHARNPHDQTRITGGSSSGSAIAVSTGAIPAALGSDTAGSLRLPAAACGILSMKPTWTRVSRAGAMPLSGLLDCVGPIARNVRDIALMMQILAGHDPRDGLSASRSVPDFLDACERPSNTMKIAVADGLIADAHATVQSQLSNAMSVFEAAGCSLTQTSCSNWLEIDQLTQLLQLPEVASAHGRFMRTRAADYGPQVRARIEFGHYISAADHQTAVRARGQILREFLDQVFGDADALILPNFADPVPTIAELDLAGGPTLMAGLARVIHYTRPVNYLGLPTLSLPYDRAPDEMLNGFQLIGRPFGEADLLCLGAAYERDVQVRLAQI